LSPAYRPISSGSLTASLGELVAATPGRVRVAIDGPPCADPAALAESLTEPLRSRGRPVVHVRAESFWHDASLRFEHGREDPEAFLSWLDAPALRREVLKPFADTGDYLPSLRDPATNRSTREPARSTEPGTVLVVSGALLLGLGLPFDLVVHLAMSAAARARRTGPADAWTLPAYDEYDETVQPDELADIVVKVDDPRHPALQMSPLGDQLLTGARTLDIRD
jgi:hypothetical protein